MPGSTSSPKIRAGSPSRSISSPAQRPLRASSRPVVEAAVASLATTPLSQLVSRSGTSAMREAAARLSPSSSASSWKTVLIGIVWMPVVRYSSSRETRACARSTMPAVRSSR